MNGLKYIRTKCNFSLNFLATKIGVSRQIISDWELGKREIPSKRKKQLSKLFGLPEEVFGEIDKNRLDELSKKPLYRFYEEGHELYKYDPEGTDKNSSPIIFSNQTLLDPDMSLDEHFTIAKQRKKEVLSKVDEIIMYDNNISTLTDCLMCINRGIALYSELNDIMECMPKQKLEYRMQFYFTVLNVLKAMTSGLDINSAPEYLNTDESEDKTLQRISDCIADIYKHRIMIVENLKTKQNI